MFTEQDRPASLLIESSARSTEVSSHHSRHTADAGAVRNLTAAIAGSDPAASSTLRHLLQQTGLVKEIHEWASSNAVELRHARDVPDMVFLELAGNGNLEFVFAQQLVRLRPSTHIVLCSARRDSSPDFLLQAMRSGVRDFLQKPYDREELSSLVRRASSERTHGASRPSAAGKLFAVLGTKGGVGTTTVSVNLAVQLAQMRGKRTLLLDFSRPMGDVSALLDLRPKFQLRDALENFKRLDSTLLSGLLAAHRSGLQVLAGAAQLEDWQHGSASAIERVVEVAQRSFDFVVMDFGSFYSAEWQNVLRAAETLLISEADLAGLAKLQRHLGALGKLSVDSRQVRLVINRWHRHDEEALKKVETGMKMPVFARLPNNFKQVSEATLRGDSLQSTGDPLSGEFRNMAARLAGQEVAKPSKKSRLGQFFSF